MSPTSCPPPPIGRNRIGRYEIIYPIAQGGMAGVYAGRLTGIAGFQRLVAVKVIHSHLSSEDNFIQMFLDEARLAAGIHHPNVGEVIEVGEEDGMYYMVCELILGQSLRSFHLRALRENVTVSSVLYAKIASATALGLQAAHDLCDSDGESLKLVHRDISPRNILLTYDGYIKLIDFGVAYAQGKISHTDVGMLKGKLGYMSPEQVKCRPLDGRSDIFTLGVVLYQMVTGQPPFSGETDFEKIQRILEHQFEKPSKIVRTIHPKLEKIILRAMARNPEERYPTAAAMSSDLEAFIKNSNESVEPKDLSRLMHSLFSEEIEYHLEKVKAFGNRAVSPKRATPGPKRATPGPKRATPGPKPLNLQVTIPEIPRLRGTPNQVISSDAPPKKSRPKKTAVIGMSIMGLLLLIFLPFLINDAESPSIPVRAPDGVNKKNVLPLATTVPTERADTPIQNKDAAPPFPSTVKIALEVSPSNATLNLDDGFISPNTKILSLNADKQVHRLLVSAEGYFDREELVSADADKIVSITLVSKPKSAVPKKKHETSRKQKSLSKKTKSASPAKSGKKKSSALESSPYQ